MLNVPMSFLERKLFPVNKKGKKPALARGASLLLTFVLLAVVIALVVLVVVPQLVSSAAGLGASVMATALRVMDWAEEQFAAYPQIVQWLEGLTVDWQGLVKNLWTFLTSGTRNSVTKISACMGATISSKNAPTMHPMKAPTMGIRAVTAMRHPTRRA